MKKVKKTIEKTTIEIDESAFVELKANFFDENYIIEPSKHNYRIDKGNKRFYVRVLDNGKFLVAPSFSEIKRTVTGVSVGLANWMKKLSKQESEFEATYSAAYGSFLHDVFADILRNKPFTLDLDLIFADYKDYCDAHKINFDEAMRWYEQKRRKIQDDLIGFVCWKREYNAIPVAIEYPLMSKKGLHAGQLDIVCWLTITEKIKKEEVTRKVLALVDVKSGFGPDFYEENELQLKAYSDLWNEEFPNLKIEKIYNYGCNNFMRKSLNAYLIKGKHGKFKPYRFKDQTDSKNLYKWDHYIELYHGTKENMKMTSLYKFDKTIEIKDGVDISNILHEIDPVQNVLNKHKENENERSNCSE